MNEITALLESSPPIALSIALNFLGLGLKKSPIADWLIPLVLPTVGAVVYPFISDWGKVGFECHNPAVLLGVYGFAIGAASVGINQALRQFLGRKNSSGDTEFFDRKKEQPK